MKCVILAAGLGSRLGTRHLSKPLCPVNGKPLIEWVITAARDAGIRDFVVVTGHARVALEPAVSELCETLGVSVSFVANNEWQKGNGLSVSAARNSVGDTFALLMSDHIFDSAILSGLIAQPLAPGEIILAVDEQVRGNQLVDLEDVTRVQVDRGNILAIGKKIPHYNAFDTGIFFCTTGLFDALDESVSLGDDSLSGGVRILATRQRARVMNIKGGYWIDVDDERAIERASALA